MSVPQPGVAWAVGDLLIRSVTGADDVPAGWTYAGGSRFQGRWAWRLADQPGSGQRDVYVAHPPAERGSHTGSGTESVGTVIGAGLAAFLRDRLDEDEQAAHDEQRWRADNPPLPGLSHAFPPLMTHGWNDPARVLEEVASKRAILAFIEFADDTPEGEARAVATAALYLLAQPYSGHPQFHPSWRLTTN